VRDGHAKCSPTDAAAELQLDLDVLGSIYLGVHSVLDLAAANRIRCSDRALLLQVDQAFRSDVPAELGFHF
jgi:predicted acetyltransferase